ncbi:RNA-binding S4 domain-containing protein [Aquabacterium sp. OR-4]|uniref:RNA-binding S4 domain-containing protein n=1 Tax=Aquabacterium sp. OR-4 TaxID=2978127 RepID=UPI0021B4A1A6|nr:RNA-binding S4 domain-containing protein [Aquabacterium sp. OR-4]MDT7838048.1 RNA-binding S4 domain-containing protein [Aquabacterium sp. OR-4]
MQQIDFTLRGEFIPLDSLLKATGAAPSGAIAKMMVAEGRVRVDGQDELRKTAKIRAGQVVQFSAGAQGLRIRVLAATDPAAA